MGLRYSVSHQKDHINSIVKQKSISKFDMTEAYLNSRIIENSTKIYRKIVSYMAGNCWINSKISNGRSITNDDLEMVSSIQAALKVCQPLSYPVNLFHGFEIYTRYQDNLWKIGDTVRFPFVLSKTPKFRVAKKFAKGYFYSKYLFVLYPPGSRQICLDVFDYQKEEKYEYLNGFETMELVDIVYELTLFRINKYYIFRPR
jgi:hypothetical protein